MNRKRVTLIILALAVVLTGVGAGSYLGFRYVVRRRAMTWRESGMAAARGGKHDEAADLLLRYLRRYPRDVEALTQYVASREQAELPNGQHLAETAAAIRLLLSQYPDRTDDRKHLLELYVKLGRNPEAVDIAKAILDKSPGDVRTLELKTESLIRLHQLRDALQAAEEWASFAPNSLSAHMYRIDLRRALEHPSKDIIADAESVYNDDQHLDDPRFEVLLGYTYRVAGKQEDAVTWLRKAAGHTGPGDDFIQTLITQMDAVGMSDESRQLLEGLVKGGAPRETRYVLARRQWERGRWQTVADLLGDLDLGSASTDATLIALKAMALSKLQRAADASACRAALAGRKGAVPRAWTTLLGRIIDNAQVEDKQIVADCRAALSYEPSNAYLRYYLGEASIRLGEIDAGIETLRQAVGQDLTWTAPSARLIELLLSRGRFAEAYEVALLATSRNPNDPRAALALASAGAAYAQVGYVQTLDGLLKMVTEIQQQLPGEETTLSIQVQLLAQKGEKGKAVEAARTAFRLAGKPSEQFFRYLSFCSRQYGLGIEEECCAQWEKTHGITPELGYWQAMLVVLDWTADGMKVAYSRAADGMKVLDEMAKRSGNADKRDWRMARARYLDAVKDPGARAAWVALADAFPGDISVQQSVASARAVQGDWEIMQKTIERLRTLTGEKGLAWRLAKARLLVERARNAADYEQGSLQLRRIIEEYPRLPEPHGLLARALDQMGRRDAAIEQLSRAAELDPSSVQIALDLARLLALRGDFDRVRQVMDRAQPYLQSATDRQNAALLLAQGSPDRAIEVLEKSGAQGISDKPSVLLARLYLQKGDLAKVEEIVREMLRQPDVGAVGFAVSLYASQGRSGDAEAALAKLDSMKLDPGIKEMAWGTYRNNVGQLREAVKHFRAATQQAPGNISAWQNLAVACLEMGDVPSTLAVIEEGQHANPNDQSLVELQKQIPLIREASADVGLRLVIISVIRNPLNSEKAVELIRTVHEGRQSGDMELLAAKLRQLVDRDPKYMPAQIQLARCLRAMGQPEQALAVAQRAMSASPNDAEPAKLIVNIAGAAGKWPELLAGAQLWKRRAPADAAMADLAIAQAHIRMEQYDAAVTQLEPYKDKALADPSRNVDLIVAYCRGLIGIGRVDEAEKKLWPLVSRDATWRYCWAKIAAEVLDGDRAVKWLDRVAGVVPESAVNERARLAECYDEAGRRLGRDPKNEVSKQLLDAATKRFAAIVEQPTASPEVIQAAAAQADRRGYLDTAELFYRRAIKKDPKQIGAVNNLAMLVIRRNGDPKEAVALASSAVQMAPGIATVRDTLARARAKAGDSQGAVAAMREAVGLEPDNAKWRIRLVQCLVDAKEMAEAGKALDAMEARRLDTRRLPADLRRQLDDLRSQLRPKLPGA